MTPGDPEDRAAERIKAFRPGRCALSTLVAIANGWPQPQAQHPTEMTRGNGTPAPSEHTAN